MIVERFVNLHRSYGNNGFMSRTNRTATATGRPQGVRPGRALCDPAGPHQSYASLFVFAPQCPTVSCLPDLHRLLSLRNLISSYSLRVFSSSCFLCMRVTFPVFRTLHSRLFLPIHSRFLDHYIPAFQKWGCDSRLKSCSDTLWVATFINCSETL